MATPDSPQDGQPARQAARRSTHRQSSLAELCAEFGVRIVYAFGSRSTHVRDWLHGDVAEIPPGASDVDIGVKAARGDTLHMWDKVRLAIAIEDLLIVRRVDLVCLEDADPFLAANIIRGERLYAADTHEADEYDLYVLRRAGDLAPHERERMALILGDKQ
jgi:predicted nucleotidyltransferase